MTKSILILNLVNYFELGGNSICPYAEWANAIRPYVVVQGQIHVRPKDGRLKIF